MPRKMPLSKLKSEAPGDRARDNMSTILSMQQEVQVVHPVSADAKKLIFRDEEIPEESTHGRAVVWRISDGLVTKFTSDGDATEYYTLEYLAKHAPDIPVPKTHGLVAWRSRQVLLMTYLSSMTLENVWSSLSEENKMFIRNELDTIFIALRSVPIEQGVPLGGIGGEGVKDLHNWAGDKTNEIMTTARQFSDWQFSYKPSMSANWRESVQSVTPKVEPDEPIVLTHGDLWPGNITVDKDEDGVYHVTGIIDWHDSRFYPVYFELSKTLVQYGVGNNEDWWKYIPQRLSPSSDPHRWLATRLWHQSCK